MRFTLNKGSSTAARTRSDSIKTARRTLASTSLPIRFGGAEPVVRALCMRVRHSLQLREECFSSASASLHLCVVPDGEWSPEALITQMPLSLAL